jgi:hypothetical protein
MAGMADGSIVVREFTRVLADALAHVAADVLLGVVLHGSAVLGDWSTPASDVDVLVVVDDGISARAAENLAAVLSADHACPGAGLEASVVHAGAALVPTAPWPFVLHATTGRGGENLVWGSRGAGDADLILHYAVAREYGWPARGPDPHTVFGAIPEPVIVGQLVAELRWAVDHGGASYAILNACRALRYRDERKLCSKTDAGNWALTREIQPALVRGALDARQAGVPSPMTDSLTEWVLTVAADLDCSA